ncbi:MAG TPA: hypothetical protein VFM05_06750, partial [Candidatus Saccharimonadales bacterium]|nr:hypothetical protein [Candidatus Saccharimonadales bacterium]
FERWVAKCNERDIHFRGIIGDAFLADQKEWYSKHSNERLKHWEQRYVSKEMFDTTHTMVIYDDVTAYYNWKAGEVFGIEIYNPEITKTHRQFYELLWEKATPQPDY